MPQAAALAPVLRYPRLRRPVVAVVVVVVVVVAAAAAPAPPAMETTFLPPQRQPRPDPRLPHLVVAEARRTSVPSLAVWLEARLAFHLLAYLPSCYSEINPLTLARAALESVLVVVPLLLMGQGVRQRWASSIMPPRRRTLRARSMGRRPYHTRRATSLAKPRALALLRINLLLEAEGTTSAYQVIYARALCSRLIN